jgi:hypothetical protein
VCLPSDFSLTILDKETFPRARCSDGSPAAYYHAPPKPWVGTKNWIFLFEGGSSCGEKARCRKDSKPPPWISNPEEAIVPEEEQLKYHPQLRHWNRVTIPYCSLDYWLGQRETATEETFGVYFSGRRIIDAVLWDLEDRHGLKEAKRIIFLGRSAGSIGAMQHLDRLAARYWEARVVGAALSGFYFYTYPYMGPGSTGTSPHADLQEKSLPSLHRLWDAYFDESCALNLGDEAWRCLLVNVSYPYIATPKFVAQAQIDLAIKLHNWLPEIPLGVTAAEVDAPVRSYLWDFSRNMTDALRAPLASKTDGVWSPACFMHRTYASTSIGGKNFSEAFSSWYFDGERVKLSDDCGILCNPTCEKVSW